MVMNVSMIRERCTIKDETLGNVGSHILSNRLSIPFGEHHVTVRGQNMHSVVRLAARIYEMLEPQKDEKELKHPEKQEIEEIWRSVAEAVFNPTEINWAAAYINSELIFASAKHHPFLDLIEKQAGSSEASYDMNVMITSENFNAAGFPGMSVEHDTNVALVLTLDDEKGRCGLIYRHPQRTTTFSFSITKHAELEIHFPKILELAADFLESIQLCYATAAESSKGLAQNREKVEALKNRLIHLSKNIDLFDDSINVAYRPEKPNFDKFLQEAQMLLARRARA